MERAYLGIDTSNYTTSAAIAGEDGHILCNIKLPLHVKSGERGLRQSDAVFQHVHAVPELVGELLSAISSFAPGDARIEAVGYSYAPRDVEGSYMPCFLVGEAVARSVALGANAPVYRFSHQAGHIVAALYSSGGLELLNDRFAAFHVSGGTTELVLVSPDPGKIIAIEKTGGTVDLSAGQLADRVGVKMGFAFPAGKYLDENALSYSGETDPVRVKVKDMYCNLSGAENKATELFDKYGDAGRTSKYVMEFISQTVLKMSEQLRKRYPAIPIVYSGGVMSSRYVKEKLRTIGGYHAEPEFSADNAAGCALLTREKHERILQGGS